MGFAIAKKIIAADGGTLQLESVAGEGTTVIVRLPMILEGMDTLNPSDGVAGGKS